MRGKKEKIKIYELVALEAEDSSIGATKTQRELCESFAHAYKTFSEGDYTTAQQLFEAIHQKFSDDFPTEFYLNRLKETKK